MEAASSPVAVPELRAESGRLLTPDGCALAFDRWRGRADAHPLLYLHGFGQTRQAWHGTATRLASLGFSGTALDSRGHGQSDWNGATTDYSMQQLIDDVNHVATTLPRPVLVGASMGGLLGLVTEGEAVNGLYSALVMVDVTPRWESQGVERILGFMGAHPHGFEDLEHAADAIASYLPHRRRRKSPQELSSLLVQRDDGRWRWHWDPRMLEQVARHGEQHQPRLIAAARRVRIPVLLVSGGLSDLVSDRTVEEFLALVPHARHVRIPDATHMVAGDRNDAFTGVIHDFLTALQDRGAPAPGAVP